MRPSRKALVFCIAAVVVIGLVAVTFDEVSNALMNRLIRGSVTTAMEEY